MKIALICRVVVGTEDSSDFLMSSKSSEHVRGTLSQNSAT